MDHSGVIELTADQYQSYMQSHNEKDYLLIDVRQSQEYEHSHIPGATLIPLSEFESRLFELPDNKELVFYCKIGSRSQMAAMLADEAEVTEKPIYHLSGGIHDWSGRTLTDFPKIKVFESAGSFRELLVTAMDMERGAERFYQYARDRHEDAPFAITFDQLSKVETAHARIIYDIYKKSSETEPEAFDAFYENLAGEILESGESLEQMVGRLESIETNICISLMELALNIEYAAYDLYRSAATKGGIGNDAADLFLDIAQAEKNHMRLIAKALADCPAGEQEGA